MSEPFVFINTYAVKEGRLDDYLNAFKEVVDLVEAKQPRMLHFATYTNDEGTEATTVQVHADADNMGYHMQIAGEHINRAREWLDFNKMSIQIYGTPTDAILDQMRELAGSGVPVSIKRPGPSTTRFPVT